MSSDYIDLPDALARLDVLLAEVGEEAMLLSELDGFLCCLAVGPDRVAPGEWWPFDWLTDERGMVRPGHEELATLIHDRLAQIEQELAEGRYAPLYEIDEETGGVVWEVWLGGFQSAMLLRFDDWDGLLRDTESGTRGEAARGLASALMLAQEDGLLDETAGEEEWAQYDEALEAMPMVLAQTAVLLYRLHR